MSRNDTTGALYDTDTVRAAERTVDAALGELFAGGREPRAVVVAAPAGAGKTGLVVEAVRRARARGLRVAVGSPTNEQAIGLVRRIWQDHVCRVAGETVGFCPGQGRTLPADLQGVAGVDQVEAKEANDRPLVVATLAKLGDAHGRGTLRPFRVLLIDEAYQANAAQYFAVGGLARLHLLVGDSGQISPFTTMPEPHRWRGLPEDPLQTAVGVLRRNHPRTPVYGLPITRRLDDRAAVVAAPFYPGLPFRAAVLPGVRGLAFCGVAGSSPLDPPLEMAARHGWADVKLPEAPSLPADPETVDLIARLVERLFARAPYVHCERQPTPRPLAPRQVAVGVSHNDQKERVREALAACGLDGVVVETANKLQGLEFEVVVAWHPLAGLAEADAFHLDPGRLCVLLTRHRQACLLVGRRGDERMLDDQVPPSPPAYLGDDAAPLLDGWEAHRQVYAALAPYRVLV